jgi:ribosome-binding factor A
MDETRHARLESRILHELSTLLMRGEIKDHRVDTLVSFSYIRLAKDAATARVGVSTVLGNQRHVERAVEGLNSAAGYLQRRLGKTLKTRSTPVLHFVEDHSIAEAHQVISTIDAAIAAENDRFREGDEQRDSASE